MNNTLWITWEEQRRNYGIANALGVDRFEVILSKHKGIRRYIECLWKTFKIFRQEHELKTVICQNPSFILALFTVLMKNVLNYTAIVDAHNGGLGLYTKSRIMKWIARFLQKHADYTIVTNEALKAVVESNGGRGIVVPDRIPQISAPSSLFTFEREHNFLFICTYAADEPYEEVFKAAMQLGSKYCIHVTGNAPNEILEKWKWCDNIKFLGRVTWEDYEKYLFSVEGIIDLTTRENCLVCGAYEAIAAETPLILSKTKALQEYFGIDGVHYTTNTHEDLAQQIMGFCSKYDKEAIKSNKERLETNWKKYLRVLNEIVYHS